MGMRDATRGYKDEIEAVRRRQGGYAPQASRSDGRTDLPPENTPLPSALLTVIDSSCATSRPSEIHGLSTSHGLTALVTELHSAFDLGGSTSSEATRPKRNGKRRYFSNPSEAMATAGSIDPCHHARILETNKHPTCWIGGGGGVTPGVDASPGLRTKWHLLSGTKRNRIGYAISNTTVQRTRVQMQGTESRLTQS